MLAPETRVMLTDALRPPVGYRVAAAVATTYSLDLTALLLAPMTFALHDDSVRELDKVDPIKLLEAVRRHASHTGVFVQAGAIHVPASYRTILTFAEECVHEVTSPVDRSMFHPKIWVVRFERDGDEPRHRFLCLSRNLTFDRSWDTLLVLDEPEPGEKAALISAQPLARFLGELPALAVRTMSPERRRQLDLLAESLKAVTFSLPEGFTAGQLLPLGFQWSEVLPMPLCERAAVISPFLDRATLDRVAQVSDEEALLLSRAETLDRMGGPATAPFESFVLQRAAEREVGEALDDAQPAHDERDVPDGLHAKTFLFDNTDEAVVVTGSANATSAGTGRNVEFDVVLTGPRTTVGIAEMWDGSRESPGLSRIAQPYAVPDEAVAAPDNEATAWDIDQFHASLAKEGLSAAAHALPEGRWELRLQVPELDSPGTSVIRPITLTDAAGWSRRLAEQELEWSPVAVRALTPFFAISTTAGSGSARTSRSAVLTATLEGDPEARRRDALGDVLRTQEDLLRYLAFLLGDASVGTFLQGSGGGWRYGDAPGGNREDVILFEPLVRALADGGRGLERVASLYTEVQGLENAEDLIPPGLGELWDVVWAAHRARAGVQA
jgi:hypothetical protein